MQVSAQCQPGSSLHQPVSFQPGGRVRRWKISGQLGRDRIHYFDVHTVFGPMTGSGTCRGACEELGVHRHSRDSHGGVDACDGFQFPRGWQGTLGFPGYRRRFTNRQGSGRVFGRQQPSFRWFTSKFVLSQRQGVRPLGTMPLTS